VLHLHATSYCYAGDADPSAPGGMTVIYRPDRQPGTHPPDHHRRDRRACAGQELPRPHHPDRAPAQAGGRSEVRILFVSGPWPSTILLVARDKAGGWNKWYARMIPRAEQLYEIYLKERAAEEGSQ
jgi:hypothetical protein